MLPSGNTFWIQFFITIIISGIPRLFRFEGFLKQSICILSIRSKRRNEPGNHYLYVSFPELQENIGQKPKDRYPKSLPGKKGIRCRCLR